MILTECHRCGMQATCVQNEAAAKAWEDHMKIHEDETAYSSWTWTVEPLTSM